MIERKIVIGLITNERFLKRIRSEWDYEFMESSVAKTLSRWCWEYYDKYNKAPMEDIELVYLKKLKKGLDKDLAEEIESEILPSLSKEYARKKKPNLTMLLDETRQYFIKRQLTLHNETVTALLEKGKDDEAQKIVEGFKIKKHVTNTGLDLSKKSSLKIVKAAFTHNVIPIIEFPGPLGDFWNDSLVRGALVAIMAPEKRGKTFWLLEFMMRAYDQGRKVAFFQAGDMTEKQQIIRTGIYLARKSNKEKYCGKQFVPVLDCIHNQADECTKKIRASDFGVVDLPVGDIRKNVTKDMLVEAFRANPTYENCYNCSEFAQNRWGTVWLKEIDIKNPLGAVQAVKLFNKFFVEAKRNIKIVTYPNGMLTVSEMENVLGVWKDEGFEPEVILLDYGDLVEPETKMEERQKQNYVWKRLRGITQKGNEPLLIVPTQTDADSYEHDLIKLKNFSEDKRKYSHVTAMYGLNQDPKNREKRIGIMRINKMVLREDAFHYTDQVHVYHRLEIGRPFLGSFY